MGASRILIVGGTGRVGKSFGMASVKLGHPTFMLVRDVSPSDPEKAELLESLKKEGVTLLKGDLNDQASLLEALKQVDVVISIVGRPAIDGPQLALVEAMKQAGTVKRFFPSEFAIANPERALPIMHEVMLDVKLRVREATEKANIPYTFFLTGAGNSFFLRSMWDFPGRIEPPRDKITIYGDGDTKCLLLDEDDIATYTVLAADDPRAENKIMYARPESCYKTQHELVAIWEEKIGHKLEKTYVSKEELVKEISELPFPKNFLRAFTYSYMVAGYKPRSEYEANAVEATELFPDVKVTSSSEYLDRYV